MFISFQGCEMKKSSTFAVRLQVLAPAALNQALTKEFLESETRKICLISPTVNESAPTLGVGWYLSFSPVSTRR
jgi:hypothetical protein